MTMTDAAREASQWQAEVLKRGGVTRLGTPEPPTGSEPVDTAIATYRHAFATWTDARTALDRCKDALKTAQTADKSAHADAILDGGKTPGTPAADKANAALVAAQRHRDAAALAVERAATQLRAALTEHGAAVAAKAEADATTAHADATAAHQALHDAADRLTTARRLHRWARAANGNYNPTVLTPLDRTIVDAVDATRTALEHSPVPAPPAGPVHYAQGLDVT